MRQCLIKVPASSANIGPGFDVLGIALSLYLTIDVTIDRNEPGSTSASASASASVSASKLNCLITASGPGSENIPLDPEANLITRTALYVLRAHDVRVFPEGTQIHIHNEIPLGRGLGSSGAAVVGGALLGNALGNLQLDKRRLMDFCLMVERHPDNISAAMYGGFMGSFLRELSGTELERVEIPLAEVLPEPGQLRGGFDMGLPPPLPPRDIARSLKYALAPEIRAVCIIPQFEVSTAKSRDVLPSAYTRQDAIYNLQRVSLLIPALGASPPDGELVHLAMQDRLHQRYRRVLIPGLADVLTSLTPRTHPGMLGICLSGAGPTVLALATRNFEDIAHDVISRFKASGVTCMWKLLDPASGAEIVMQN